MSYVSVHSHVPGPFLGIPRFVYDNGTQENKLEVEICHLICGRHITYQHEHTFFNFMVLLTVKSVAKSRT